ncbi:Uncharacterised protein [Mycobacterium tuberculosis]|nr:Uncharacterised protein [Mycobacterium tuberculosis]
MSSSRKLSKSLPAIQYGSQLLRLMVFAHRSCVVARRTASSSTALR